jgi:hypothetical protein
MGTLTKPLSLFLSLFLSLSLSFCLSDCVCVSLCYCGSALRVNLMCSKIEREVCVCINMHFCVYVCIYV